MKFSKQLFKKSQRSAGQGSKQDIHWWWHLSEYNPYRSCGAPAPFLHAAWYWQSPLSPCFEVRTDFQSQPQILLASSLQTDQVEVLAIYPTNGKEKKKKTQMLLRHYYAGRTNSSPPRVMNKAEEKKGFYPLRIWLALFMLDISRGYEQKHLNQHLI